MTFQTLNDVVKAIISTIENAAVSSVKALKANTFSTKVTNLPDVQKVSGKVEVTNQVELTRVEKTLASLAGLVKDIKAPKSISVDNFPKYPSFPDFPKEIRVSNFPKVEPPKEIKVSNQPIRELEAIKSQIGEMTTVVRGMKLDPKIEVQAPKPERLVVPPANVTVTQQEIDYEKLATAIADQIPNFDYKKFGEVIADKVNISVTGGGGGKYAYKYGNGDGGAALVDDDRHVQVDVLEMPEINIPVQEGLATAENQELILTELQQKTEPEDEQKVGLSFMIEGLLAAIANPSYVDKSANQMRAQVTGSLTSVTTVTTVTNMTNLGSFPGDHLQRLTSINTWANSVRSLIT